VSRARALFAAAAALLAFAPGAAFAAAAPDGKAMFAKNCAICHLQGGAGTFMLGRRLGPEKALLLARKDLQPVYVTTVVRRGLASMPWFTRVELTDAELASVTAYLAGDTR